MKITILVEGKTEGACKAILVSFLKDRLQGVMPRLSFAVYDGRIPMGESLRRRVAVELEEPNASDYVIALTDVYTGCGEFLDAADAKAKMAIWVGTEPRFFPHVALYDFEAWLIPYWADILILAGHNQKSPGNEPELINHSKPPAHRLKALFEIGKRRDSYVKPRDAERILRKKDLMVAINK